MTCPRPHCLSVCVVSWRSLCFRLCKRFAAHSSWHCVTAGYRDDRVSVFPHMYIAFIAYFSVTAMSIVQLTKVTSVDLRLWVWFVHKYFFFKSMLVALATQFFFSLFFFLLLYTSLLAFSCDADAKSTLHRIINDLSICTEQHTRLKSFCWDFSSILFATKATIWQGYVLGWAGRWSFVCLNWVASPMQKITFDLNF